jgi:hypothetical protein
MGKDLNYDVIHRGEELKFEHMREGRAVFIQRELKHGGGYWLIRTFRDFSLIDPFQPVSLRQGIEFLLSEQSIRKQGNNFIEDFTLDSPPSGEQA